MAEGGKRLKVQRSNGVIEDLPLWFLDALRDILVPSCGSCISRKVKCIHMTAEDNEFPFFWKLRAVSKSWNASVYNWLKERRFILIAFNSAHFLPDGACGDKIHPLFQPKIKALPKGNRRRRVYVCHKCGNMGHYAKKCDILSMCHCTSKVWKDFVAKYNLNFLC